MPDRPPVLSVEVCASDQHQQHHRNLLSTAQLAAELGVTAGTLRNWRTAGRGPRGARIGGRVRYRRADVDAWITQQTERDPLVDRRERVSGSVGRTATTGSRPRMQARSSR